jgi:hypothetical protein
MTKVAQISDTTTSNNMSFVFFARSHAVKTPLRSVGSDHACAMEPEKCPKKVMKQPVRRSVISASQRGVSHEKDSTDFGNGCGSWFRSGFRPR